MISLIVAKTSKDVIGINNDLPWYLPADLKHFKEITSDHAVVMGRKTFESIIKRLGHALPNRDNIVLTRDTSYASHEAHIIHDISYIQTLKGNTFVIGGAEIYNITIDQADRIYVTEIHADVDGDTYFPDINSSDWREISRESHLADDKNKYDYAFVIYERITYKK